MRQITKQNANAMVKMETVNAKCLTPNALTPNAEHESYQLLTSFTPTLHTLNS